MQIKKAAAYALHIMMYIARHKKELPATANKISKAEGIPLEDVKKIFPQLIKGGFVKNAKDRKRGYVFAKPPEDISMLELFELIEGKPLFDNCLLKHCECGGTPQNCIIYSKWSKTTAKIKQLFDEISIVDVILHHPEHRFYSLPEL